MPAAFLGTRAVLAGRVLAGILALLTVAAVPASSQLWSRFRLGAEAPALQPLDVRGERFEVDAGMAGYLARSTELLNSRVPADEPLFVAPYFSIFYPLLEREAPVWNLYFLNPAEEDAQRALIEDLTEVDWVWLADMPMFGPERTFRATHPLVFRHLEQEFEAQATPFPNHALLRRRER